MKNITKSFIALFALLALSCNTDDVQDRPVVQGIDAPVLEAPETGNVYVLNPDTMDQLAERFVWSAANLGAGIIPNYAIEIDFLGNNFATPATVGITSGTLQFAASQSILNSALLTLGATPYENNSFEVRIKAYVADVVMYSNSVEMLITPYIGVVPLKQLYIVGDATEFGYDNNAGNTPMFRNPIETSKYYYTGYFAAGGLKMIESMGNWNPQYGSISDGVLGVSGADGSNEPSPITITTAGYYTFEVNLEDMTYTLTPFDASGAVAYATIGITGSATPEGWPDNGIQDVDMTASTTNPHIWKITGIVLSEAEAKFRANNAWDVSWGGTNAISGIATIGGANIPVSTAGTYNVWFNDLDGRYIFILQ